MNAADCVGLSTDNEGTRLEQMLQHQVGMRANASEDVASHECPINLVDQDFNVG